ncbi:hypothetical protein [Pyrobaculum ferrireducens]|uniref:Uncharacterized protein n=1 Tax=Pyrobaculum ferrireducens TaxID=1104324 RepID=G7VBU3_9CREN|nr:hypothetical protein [Pyrobaculum ferrireducens]AET33710.1 hypothetical protein P186_2320 [Pyrobaculum ferrireducens]
MGMFVDIDEVLTKLRERCGIALRGGPPPTLEAVLEESARRGVLYGNAATLFKKWRLYMRYVGEAVPEALSLPVDKATQFRQFVDGLIQLLDKAEKQAREKLAGICKAVEEGRVKIKSGKTVSHICAGGVCIHAHSTSAPVFKLPLHDISAKLYFPSIGLGPEEVEAFQLGWRASDEATEGRRPEMGTTKPWQLLAWLAVRSGVVRIYLHYVHVNASGLSLETYAVARDWEQRWSKEEAQRLAVEAIQRGDYRPLLTWFLGDGVARWENLRLYLAGAILGGFRRDVAKRGSYATREISTAVAKALLENAGIYGRLLEVLRSHKWEYLKTLASYKPPLSPTYVTVRGVEMRLHLSARTLYAERRLASEEEARRTAERLAPHASIYKDRNRYVVYIPWSGLKELMQKDPALGRAVVDYLGKVAERKPIAKKLLAQITPLF